MKISISLEEPDLEALKQLVDTGKAANLSHAVRICIRKCEKEAV